MTSSETLALECLRSTCQSLGMSRCTEQAHHLLDPNSTILLGTVKTSHRTFETRHETVNIERTSVLKKTATTLSSGPHGATRVDQPLWRDPRGAARVERRRYHPRIVPPSLLHQAWRPGRSGVQRLAQGPAAVLPTVACSGAC